MRNSRIFIIAAFVMLMLCACSRSYKNVISNTVGEYLTEERKADDAVDGDSSEDGAVQEPAWTYYERLSYLFGGDSICIGMSDDMNYPEWYAGCFVNDMDRLTINVVGDSTAIRRMLVEKLGGNEFDLGSGVCSRVEQSRILGLLRNAISESDSDTAKGNITIGTKGDGSIEVCLQGDESTVEQFRKEVFDSPILRFEAADRVGIISDVETLDAVDEADCEELPHHVTSPQFPGGEDAMLSYIYDNLIYPQETYGKNIQGRVVVRFLVDRTGVIDSITIVRGKDPNLDVEAKRLVGTFPKFSPGTVDDTPVEQWVEMPVFFSISKYDERHSKKYKPFQFDNGDDYICDGLYRVIDENEKIGYADSNGNTVISPRFACAFPFDDGKAKVADVGKMVRDGAEHWRWESEGWYYIDKTGRKLD